MPEETLEQKLYRRWQAFLSCFGMVATGPSGSGGGGNRGGNGNTILLLLILLMTFFIFLHVF